MADKIGKGAPKGPALPKMTSSALKGKQSVRARFKLSEACIHAINIVSTQLGLKHRSLFDYLVEDTDALQTIARDIVKSDNDRENRALKSFILSRETLNKIDDVCGDLNISRNTLIENSVRRLLPIIEKEIENHRKRKDMLALVDRHFKDGNMVLKKIEDRVGVEDPIYRAFKNAVSTCKQVNLQINDIISKGKVLEGFDPGSLR